jgi:acetylornithine deacetylase/succinyl-diaminopimelate desuccinylase-like protein
MPDITAAVDYARNHRTQYLDELKEWVAIPSVSTQSEHAGDVQHMAKRLAGELKRLGMTRVDIMPTKRHPILYAEWLGAPGKPTVLVYGHYDVQPAELADGWSTNPFEPTIKDDYLIARGASDMKGQLFAHFKALEALIQQGDPPINLKYLLEGEEEIGSPSLPTFIDEHGDLLKADFVLNCDGGIQGPGIPSLTYALRGLAYFELEVRGPSKDLHSGLFGGSVLNPAQALCELIAGMHDADGRVTLPGFYDRVRELDAEEREDLARVPYTDDEWFAMTGAPALWGEKGYTTIERVGARPTLEVNGIWGGFIGEGEKTVLPAVARAKISTRLVADQAASDVRGQFEAYLKANAPAGITWKLSERSTGPAAIMDRHSKPMAAAAKALEMVFGKAPIYRREGGSIPIVGLLQEKLGLGTVLLGFATPDDGIHGPNERQYLPNTYKGIETHIHFLASLGST